MPVQVEPETGAPSSNTGKLFSLTDVYRIYGEEPVAVHALDGVSVEVNAGDFMAIIGPSGSEAIAMTRETIVASHKKGVSKHSIDRNVFWTISKQQEDEWKITGMAYNFGPVVD